MILSHLAYFAKYLPIALLHPRLKSIVAPRFYAEKYVDVPPGMGRMKVHFLMMVPGKDAARIHGSHQPMCKIPSIKARLKA